MIDLDELIHYWEDRLLAHPPMTSLDWHETVKTTLHYLRRLKKLTEGGK